MNLEELKSAYIKDYLKYISANENYNYDDFSYLEEELAGRNTFSINGIDYSFKEDFKLEEDGPEFDYSLDDNDIHEMLVGIYNGMKPDLQAHFVEEMLNNKQTIPYKTTEYFDKIQQEISEKQIQEETIEEETELKEGSDLSTPVVNAEGRRVIKAEDIGTIEQNTSEKVLAKEKLDFSEDGPEIKKYKDETEALKIELEKLEKAGSVPVTPEDPELQNLKARLQLLEQQKANGNNDIDYELEAYKKQLGLLEEEKAKQTNPVDNTELESLYKELEELSNVLETKKLKSEEDIDKDKQPISIDDLLEKCGYGAESLEVQDKTEKNISDQEEYLQILIRRKENFIKENNITEDTHPKTVIIEETKTPSFAPNEVYGEEVGEYLKGFDRQINEQKKLIDTLKQAEYKRVFEYKEHNRIKIEVWKFSEAYEKEINELVNTLDIINNIRNQYYEERKGIPYELYGYQNRLNPVIQELKTTINEKCGIRSWIDINSPENRIMLEKIVEARKVNASVHKELEEKFNVPPLEDKEENDKVSDDVDISSIEERIQEIKKQIEEKQNNPIAEPNSDLDEKINEVKNKIAELEKRKGIDNTETLDAEIENLRKIIQEKENNKIIPTGGIPNPNQEAIDKLKGDIKNREANIALYYECLNDIKKLSEDVSKGLDTNSEEFAKRVEAIDNKKMKLPPELSSELNKYLMQIKNNGKKPIPTPIDQTRKNPKLTFKTFMFLIGGLGLGAGLGLAVGPVGLIVGNVALAGSKLLIERLRAKARKDRILGKNEVTKIEEPDNKLKQTMKKFKDKFMTEENLRDISWGLTGALVGMNVAHILQSINTPGVPSNSVDPSHTPTPEPTPTPQADPLSEIRLGDNVAGHNVTVGHDTANWAVNGTNSESLLGQYVNGDSVFQRFAVMNQDGTVGQIINSNGVSINDLVASGVDPSTIAVDVGKGGISQAWVSVQELTKNVVSSVGGKGL